jgi:uncharacterized protein (DUF1697 family)
MLRGINVGQKTLKMDRLRSLLEELGLAAVRTYVQSGNAVFETPQGSPVTVAKKIEKGILREFEFEVPVFIKTLEEMEKIACSNPFVKDKTVDQSKLHITFLSSTPDKDLIPGLAPLAAKSERFRVMNQEAYLYCPDGYGRTKLSNSNIERKLSVIGTTRNWRTVMTLLEMARA